MSMNKNHYVAIMAGGIGSRFWPMSRTAYPKQFLDIVGTGKTLIQQTFDRFADFIPKENIYIVTSNEYIPLVKEQLPTVQAANILGEPSRKNTAPCIAYISHKLNKINPEGCLICAPADHLVLEQIAFKKVCIEALSFVRVNNALVTLGIKPSHPNTGYGYIQHEQYEVSDNVYQVKTFTEKPSLEIAKTFIASGDFLWNAGIFVWKVKNIVQAFEKYLPEMNELFVAEEQKLNTEKEQKAIEKIYPLCTSVSIDYGIMEKADNVYIIPSSFGWSDLGTWNSAYENIDKDNAGNAVSGKNLMLIDSANNMIHVGQEKLVVLQGIENHIVIDTGDVLLVCSRTKEQDIKDYVAEIKRSKGDRFL